MSENINQNTNEILSFAETLAGDSADTALLTAMCAAAASELETRLREGVSPTALGSTFNIAAGILAVSMYCAAEHPEQIKSFKAGNVSVEYGGGEVSPESLRSAAEIMLAAYLKDRGFDFLGVQG